jgi:hypothetical protein
MWSLVTADTRAPVATIVRTAGEHATWGVDDIGCRGEAEEGPPSTEVDEEGRRSIADSRGEAVTAASNSPLLESSSKKTPGWRQAMPFIDGREAWPADGQARFHLCSFKDLKPPRSSS